jgi:glycosyltransferase involved in cell wall biosynthesis
MINSRKIKATAIYITTPSISNRGVVRYVYSLFDKCNFDEKKVLYISTMSSWTRSVLKSLKENLSDNDLNVIFIRSAPILDSLGPILFKLFFNRKVVLIAPLFHLNPLSLRKNRYDRHAFIFSLMQRSGALLEILFADIFLTENTYIEKYIHKFRKKAYVIVKQLGIEEKYIPDLQQMLTASRDIDFLYVGGLDILKGVKDILKAFKPISRDYSLVLAGYGNKEWIEKIVEKENIKNISIYTNISEEEKFKLYLRSKVYVFPSVADGVPITFHEAWAYGNLVVAYMLPTYVDIKDRILGVPQLNIKMLREKMIYALSNYDKYKDLIINNYWYAVKNSNSEENIYDICNKIFAYLNRYR